MEPNREGSRTRLLRHETRRDWQHVSVLSASNLKDGPLHSVASSKSFIPLPGTSKHLETKKREVPAVIIYLPAGVLASEIHVPVLPNLSGCT